MKKLIIALLAIAFMAISPNAMADKESWAEYDQRLEKQYAELQDKLPMGNEEDPFIITSIEKRGKVIITTIKANGEYSWLAIAKERGGVEKFKAFQQRWWARMAMETNGIELSRWYTMRYIYVDKGKEIFTVDVTKHIIMGMIMENVDSDKLKYMPAPLIGEEIPKYNEYEKYLEEGGYPPAGLTPEEIHKFREFKKYSDMSK